MAYFNGFPATYQPMYPQYTYQQAQQNTSNAAQNQQNGIIWVQGEAGAKSYLVAPNTTVQLWDSESQTIFLKSADASGMPSMKVLDYTIRETGKIGSNTAVMSTGDNLSVFATKDEIKAVSDQITALRERVDTLTKKKEEKDE